MKRKGIFRCISLLLAVIVLITSVPQNTYAETARIDDEATTSACLENEDSLVTPLDKGVSEPETVSESGENESTDENTSKSEDGESADENISENSAESEQSTDSLEDTYSEIDSILDEEDMEVENVTLLDAEAGGSLSLSASLESVSVPEKGYSWDKDTLTLTLDGANLEKLSIYCNATVVVNSDSKIENSSSSALLVSGAAENVTITGTGELKIISHSGTTYALGTSNDGKPHRITVSGASLTVNCVNDSTREAVYSKGELQITNGATLKATTSGNYGIGVLGALKVTAGAKVITDTPKNEGAIYLSGNNTSLIVSGEGSCLTSNKSEKEGLSKPVIATDGAYGYEYSIEIKDGGKLTANDISENCLISSSTATVDLRGGKIEVHAKGGEEFPAESSMIYAKKIMCNEDGLTNAKIDEDGNIVMAVKSDTWSYEYAGLDFTNVPDAVIGVVTGNSTTLTVATDYVGTAETPTVSYQWYKNGEIIEGATDASYIVPSTLTAGMYEYYCKASATFTFGSRVIETNPSKVYVTASGKISTEGLTINSELDDTDAIAEKGWSWNKSTQTLTLDGAVLPNLIINCPATINVSSDSYINCASGNAFLYSSNVTISGSGKLTIVSEGTDAAITNVSGKNATLTISGESTVVNVKARYEAVKNLDGTINIKEKATVNLSSDSKTVVKLHGTLNATSGSKFNAQTSASDKSIVYLYSNAKLNITGKATTFTLDGVDGGSGYFLYSYGNYSNLVVDDLARLICRNCSIETAPLLSLDFTKVKLGTGRVELYANAGNFPSGRHVLVASEMELVESGLSNTTSSLSNTYLYVKDAAANWIYKGDKPYLSFSTQPQEKAIVQKGNTLSLSAEAVLNNSEETPDIHYQWYFDNEVVAGATNATLEMTTAGIEPGEYKAECKATMTTVEVGAIEATSTSTRVVVAKDAKIPRTERLNLSSMASTENAEEGWNWNKESLTLTLTDYRQSMAYSSGNAIVLPANSVIKLVGDNYIFNYDGNSGIYAKGNLLVYGSGNLEVENKVNYYNRAIFANGRITLMGTLTEGERATGGADVSLIRTKMLASSKLKAIITGNGKPAVFFDKAPEEKVYTSSVGGVSPTITTSATAIGLEGKVTYKYQWYVTNDHENPANGAVAVKGATSTTLKAPVTERGGKYYYCVVTVTCNGKTYSATSDTYCVVVAAKGKKAVTSTILLGNASAGDEEAGWKFTPKNGDTPAKLELDDFEGFIPFAINSDSYRMFVYSYDKLEVVLKEGSVNNVGDCSSTFWIYTSTPTDISIKGNGTFNLYGSRASLINSRKEGNIGSLSISEGAKVIEKEAGSSFYNSQTKLTVSGASMRFADVPMDAVLDINVENSGYLYFDATRTLYADSINVKTGCELYINKGTTGKALQISKPATGVTGKITVGGTMSINTLGDILLYMKSDTEGASKERFIIEEGAAILLPADGNIDTLFDSNDGTYDIYAGSELLIAPSTYKRINITSATAVSGSPYIGNILTAGVVNPAGATVSYQWQYADTAKSENDVWKDIPSATEKSFYLNQEKYTGKYIRAKISGCGKYIGTVYSTFASPVKTDGATMVDFIVDGYALGEYSRAATLWLQGDEYPDEVLMTVVAEDPSAQIVIKNVTEGFGTKTDAEKTINGSSGMMPFKYNGASTSNKIKITITSGESTKVYNVDVCKYEPETKVYIQSATNSTLKIKDSLDNVVDSVSGEDYKYVIVEPGKKYTIEASTTRAGWIVTNLGNKKYDKASTLTGDVRNAEFTVARGKIEKFYATDILVKAPQVSVSWGPDNSNGCYILANWEKPTPAISTDTGYTGRVSAKLYDEEGNPVKLHEKNSVAPDGFYIYSDDPTGIGHIFKVDDEDRQLSLDTSKSYTVKLWYDATDISQCEIQELKVSPVDLSAKNHRVLVSRPVEGTTVKTVFINEKARAFNVKSYPVEDEEEFKAMRSPSELGCVDISVSSTANLGTRYVVIYSETDSGEIISDVLTVEVIETSGDVKVSLDETKGTLDIYRSDNVVVPLSISGSAAKVTAVSFVESSNTTLSDRYRFVTDGGVEPVLEPVGLQSAENGNVDWTKVAKDYKGSFKAKLKVKLTDNSTVPATETEYTTDEFYTLTIAGTAPAASVKAVKFNSFYSGDSSKLEITSKSGKVVSTVVDATKTSGKTVACPDFVSVSEDGLETTLINSKLINNKGNGKIYLNVKIDGYRIPAPATVSVSAAYTAPKIKLSETTVTVPTDASKYADSKMLYIMSADKKVSFESLNITDMRVANKADLIKLSDKDQKQYAVSKYFTASSYNVADGSFGLAKAANIMTGEFVAGKVLLIATIGGNDKQEIMIPLTIKTVNAAKATLKMDKTSLTLNSYLDDKTGGVYGVKPMTATVISSVDGISFEDITWTVTDSSGKGDYKTYLDITKQSTRGQYSFKTNANTLEGTYKVNFFVPGIVKPATINVTVKGTIPTIKFGTSSVTIDRLADYSKGTEWKIPIALSDDSITRTAESFTYEVIDSKKNTVENIMNVYFGGMGNYMTISPGTEIANGTYNIAVTYTMASGQKSIAKLPVKVVGKAPTIKVSKSSLVLNPYLGKQDCAVVTFSRPENCSFNYAGVLVYDNKNQSAPDAIDCSYDIFSGVLRLNPRANIVPGMTYKVAVTDNLTAYGTNIYTTNYVTVKTLKAGKSGKTDITVKTSTKGKIDMSRPDSTMQVINTYNGWNSEVATEEGNPVVSFEVYAYDKKNKPYKCEETGYQHSGDSGLVAKGDSNGYAATSLDWFKDVDASQYGISLQLNPENPAVTKLTAADGFYDLTYKIVVKTTFVKYISSTENMTLTGETKFTLIAGTVKLAAPSPNKVTLNSKNRFDSKIVKIKLTDNDAASIDITEVSSVNNLYYDATLIKVKDGYAYVAIGWKDDLVSVNHKNGKMTLDFYAGYNSIDRGKKNATAAVTVEAR